jgi:MFS family permease
MTRLIYPFMALLISLSVMLLGSGLLATLLALRMELEQFTTTTIGLVMACYSVGYVMATVWFRPLLVRIGHIRGFAVLAALASGSTLLYPLLIHPVPWAITRTFFGFAIAGLYMITESWLNQRTPKEYRGRILAFYGMATYAALGGSQALLNLWPVEGYQLFSLAAFLLGVSLIPVALTRSPTPELLESHAVGVRQLYAMSPLAALGAAVSGGMVGSFLALGPVFGSKVGLSVAEVSLLIGAAMLGGLLFQWPIGRYSDNHSRRLTIAGVTAGLAITSVLLILFAPAYKFLLFLLAIVWGGLAFTVYPLCLALINDYIDPEELIGAGAGLLLMHGLGLIVGPMLMGMFMQHMGPWSLFGALAAAAALLAFFSLWRHQTGPEVEIADQAEYVVVPSATPFAATLDPRVEELQLELPFEHEETIGDILFQEVDLDGNDSIMEQRA